jgi:hypothetical protein
VLDARPVEAIPLDSRHQALGKFESANDNNLLRFLAASDRLVTTVADPDVRRPGVAESRGSRPGLKLLSLDGGGVKGLYTILVLKRLLEEVARLEEAGGQTAMRKRPCDYFDLIGGTSTGGLLAIMLGRLQMDTSACIVQPRIRRRKRCKCCCRRPLVLRRQAQRRSLQHDRGEP